MKSAVVPNENISDNSNWFEEIREEREQTEEHDFRMFTLKFAEIIYEYMETNKVTKAEMARRLGVTRARVTQMLKGRWNFQVETLVRVARVFDCNAVINFEPKISCRQKAIKEMDVSPD